jgi:hypothetical protein
MRLNFTPTNEIFFKKTPNEKMKGFVKIQNFTSNTIFSFKVNTK